MSNNQPHIVVLSPGFPIHEEDTSCLPFLQALLLALKSNVRLTVVCEDYPIKQNYSWHGIPVITLRKKKFMGKVIARLTLTSTLTRLHQSNKLDGLHCFWLNWAAVSADAWCQQNQLPMWLTLAGQEPSLPRKWTQIFNSLKAKKYAVSNFHRQQLIQRGMPTLKAIPWHVPTDYSNQPRIYDFIWCGSFIEVKRPSWFIEILLLLKQKGWNGRAIMVGQDVTNKFGESIKSTKLAENVVLTGLISAEAVRGLMKQARILVHTARYEAFGRVLAEALSCGCQVVSTPVGWAYDEPNIHTASTKADLANLCYNVLSHHQTFPSSHQKVLPEEIYLKLYTESDSIISE